MTNKQTIDGVSIEKLKRDDRLFHVSKNWRSCGRGWVKFIHDEGDGLVRVRHENGAVPTVKLSNLQMQAMTPEQELSEFYEELSTGGKLTKRALCHIKSLQAEIAALNKPAAQPQGEVESLRRLAEDSCNELIKRCLEHSDQLAERDALLREVVALDPRGEFLGWQLDGKIDAILSTSAEPKPRGEAVAWTVVRPDGSIDQCYATCFKDEADEWVGTLVDGFNLEPLYRYQPAPVEVVMPELESALEAWWESDGQYCRAGGGSYEKTFAYRAYEAALSEVARLNGVKP